jgi:hypothetical protein
LLLKLRKERLVFQSKKQSLIGERKKDSRHPNENLDLRIQQIKLKKTANIYQAVFLLFYEILLVMSDETEKIKPEEEFGVAFGDVGDPDTPKDPGPEIHETTDKHLSPTKDTRKSEENVFDVTRAFDDEAVEMGTIVSDKKRKRTSIGHSIKSAFGEWLGKTKKQFGSGLKIVEEKLEKKEPKVQPGKKDRSEIIEKAKKETVQPPKEDHHIIIEESKTLPKDAERIKGAPYKIKKEKTETPQWETKKEEVPKVPEKAKTKIQTPDMRQTMVAPVVEKRIKKDIHSFEFPQKQKEDKDKKKKLVSVPKATTPEPPKRNLPPIKPRDEKPKLTPPVFVSPKITEHSEYASAKKEVDESSVPPPEISRESEDSPIQKPVPHQAPAREELQDPEPIATPAEQPVTEMEEVPQEKTSLERRIDVVTAKTKQTPKQSWKTWTRFFIIGVIVLIAVVLGVIAARTFNVFEAPSDVPQPDETNVEEERVNVPSFFPVDNQIPISIVGSSYDFFTSLNNELNTPQDGVTQFYPIQETETRTLLVQTWDLFSFLQAGLPLNVVRVLDNVSMFGGVKTDAAEPFFIVRSYNFDSLFAGMLEWETTMYDDFLPLFESDSPVSGMFVDAVKNNASVRVLYNTEGEEVLLYAFINRSTVVITSSTKALAKIVERF